MSELPSRADGQPATPVEPALPVTRRRRPRASSALVVLATLAVDLMRVMVLENPNFASAVGSTMASERAVFVPLTSGQASAEVTSSTASPC